MISLAVSKVGLNNLFKYYCNLSTAESNIHLAKAAIYCKKVKLAYKYYSLM